MRVIVQGFGPFGGHAANPSELVVRSLHDHPLPGVDLQTVILPVTRAAVEREVPELIASLRPDVWIGVGLWAGRADVTVERFAMNLLDFFLPDGDGLQPRDEPIDPDSPIAFRTPFPHQEVLAAWKDQGIPAAISNTAGAYLCNLSLFLATREMTRLHGDTARAGFVHIPHSPETIGEGVDPTLPLADLSSALRIAVRVAAAR